MEKGRFHGDTMSTMKNKLIVGVVFDLECNCDGDDDIAKSYVYSFASQDDHDYPEKWSPQYPAEYFTAGEVGFLAFHGYISDRDVMKGGWIERDNISFDWPAFFAKQNL